MISTLRVRVFHRIAGISSFIPVLFLGFPSSAFARAQSPGNAGRGEVLFQQSCVLCHSTGRQAQPMAGQGPLLAGVFGRKAAALTNYGYTKALASSGLRWDAATLDRFLETPTATVPGTNMVISVPAAEDRRDLIAFMATLAAIATSSTITESAPHVPGPGDWQNDAPGARHHVKAESLPPPYATQSAGNHPRTLERPEGATLAVPAGFKVKPFAAALSGPRLLRTAPNGDIFIAETRQNRIRILRAIDGAEIPSENRIFADKLRGPFGIAFYPATGEPQWIYVANLNSIVRFPYRSGDLEARGPAEIVVDPLSDSASGHNTRDLAFSLDGKKLFIAIGSATNIADGMPGKSEAEIRQWESSRVPGAAWGKESNRATILASDPSGKNLHLFATGLRNPVGISVQPDTGELWASINERDGLGDDLVPDYVTRVKAGGFYGWPWYYLGAHEDPRLAGQRPDLADKVIVPDVLLQAHSAALQLAFYPANVTGANAFPAEYRGDLFVALHGSWNRAGRTGGKVVRIRLRDGKTDGSYEDFLTGFVIDDQRMWGRPVGVTIAKDGALLVSDDANGTLWRVSPASY